MTDHVPGEQAEGLLIVQEVSEGMWQEERRAWLTNRP